MTWPAYQSTVRDLDASLCALHALEQTRKEQLQQTITTLAHLNKGLTEQQQRIDDVVERLPALPRNLLEQATPPHVEPGGIEHDLDNITSESTACDQALTDLEKQASKSPWLPEWSDKARSALAGAIFAILPVVAVINSQITGFWSGILRLMWWFIATAITGIAAEWVYKKLCTPPLREWHEWTKGGKYLQKIDTRSEIGPITFAAPSALIMLYKIFTGPGITALGAIGLLAVVAASAMLFNE